MAGKIGSNITSEIGTMRVTEQIDSLEIMGVNSAGYLILPKIVAVVFIFPFLYILSVFFGLLGGLVTGPLVGVITIPEYIEGIQWLFHPYYVNFLNYQIAGIRISCGFGAGLFWILCTWRSA